MTTRPTQHLLIAAILALLPYSMVAAQEATQAQAASPENPTSQNLPKVNFDRALKESGSWYFSWGYSRQQYAPSDIHVSQPSQGNDFTVEKAEATDFPSSAEDSLNSLVNLDITNPQENIRIGKFLDLDETFAIEFSIDHSKYNTVANQTANVSGTINGKSSNGPMVLNKQNFDYALHNGLNHLMVNAVWLHHLAGPVKKSGELQLISRVGAGILLPHADNTVLGKQNNVGPKNENVCCTSSKDWWQINGWTAGVEVGVRYRFYKSVFLELSQKIAYGVLQNVPVYEGVADQKIWMSEQVLSLGLLF